MSIKTHTTNRGTVYEVRLRGPDGREVSRRFRTKADAANYEAAQVAAKARGTWVDPTASSMTFAAAAEEWMASNPAKRASSLDRDRSALRKHLLPPLGHRRIGAITKPEVQALVNNWTERLEARSVTASTAPCAPSSTTPSTATGSAEARAAASSSRPAPAPAAASRLRTS